MDGADSLKRQWAVNRTRAYYGSKLHFMRSYYDSSLADDGFLIDLLDENNNTKFDKIANVYDTTYYSGLDSTNEIEVWFPERFSVTYTRKPDPEVPEKIQAA